MPRRQLMPRKPKKRRKNKKNKRKEIKREKIHPQAKKKAHLANQKNLEAATQDRLQMIKVLRRVKSLERRSQILKQKAQEIYQKGMTLARLSQPAAPQHNFAVYSPFFHTGKDVKQCGQTTVGESCDNGRPESASL